MASTTKHDITIESGGHSNTGTSYGSNGVKDFASGKHGTVGAFFDAAIAGHLKTIVAGKKVLDVGCGVGDWCQLAALYGAESVDGFDIQEKMVELAQNATSKMRNVSICMGDVMDMPYSDSSVDVAISLLVACNLSLEAYAKHFMELYRVLSPGGKAVFLAPLNNSHTRLYIKVGEDKASVENRVLNALQPLPKYPTTSEINKALTGVDEILCTCFTLNDDGDIFNVTSVDQLHDGQPIWRKTETMLYPNYFYAEETNTKNILAAGFQVDDVKNYFTEENRQAHNRKNPPINSPKDMVEYPIAWVYHISKPTS